MKEYVDIAIKVGEILHEKFYKGSGIMGYKDMPEEIKPPGIDVGSYEHLMFITLTVAIDYQRDAPTLWKNSRLSIKDSEINWLYDPKIVSKKPLDEIIDAMKKYKLSKKQNKDAKIWMDVSTSFSKYFSNNPHELFKKYNYDALLIMRAMKQEYKKMFPYLSGNKILPLWLRMLHDVMNINFKNIELIPIPVDVHVARATFATGCLKGKFKGQINTIFKSIDNVWKKACEELDFYRLRLDEPLWNLSKYGCSPGRRNSDTCSKVKKCPVGKFCVTGVIKINQKKGVIVDT
ncbi:MAG: hypothetical protein ACTSVV_13425 [Promethearchaeota archaeon]